MSDTAERIRVLYVASDTAGDSVTSALERYDVHTVAGASEARARLAGEAFDVLVAGTGSQSDARSLLEAVRGAAPDLPVLLLVGPDGEDDIDELLAAGATDCVRTGGAAAAELLANRVENAAGTRRTARERDTYERRFAAMFDDPNILAGLLAPDGTLLDANEASLTYIDADREDVIGTPFWETPWWAPEQRDAVREHVERAAAGEYVAYDEQLISDPERSYNSAGVIRPVSNEANEVVALIVSARDVTESRERQRELERKNKRLEEFAEVLTHDVRNPLNIATGYLDILRETHDEGAVEKCANALGRIDSLIDEIQTAVLQGRSAPEEQPIELSAAAREAWSTTDARNATLEIEGEMNLRADPAQFRRLLENLFRNAVEHGSTNRRSETTDAVEHGSPSDDSAEPGAAGEANDVTVRVVALENGFAIDDDGVGLPADVAEGVFERGFTTTKEGTGFGLSIVRNIAESHGWSVDVGESPSGGARFRFSQVLHSTESVIEMEAGGEDIWNTQDKGHFYHATVTGDFDARVNVSLVENTHAWAKGGLMVRSGLNATASHVMVRRQPNGASTAQWRPSDGASARSLTSLDGRERQEQPQGEFHHDWLRLVREDGTVRAYTSATGDDGDWVRILELDAADVKLPETVYLGVAGTSHNRGETATVRFKHLDGVEPTKNDDLGDPVRSGSVRLIRPMGVTARDPVDVTSTAVTARGVAGPSKSSNNPSVRFEYREVTDEEWRRTDTVAFDDTGEVRTEISGLTPRRYYEYRVVTGDGDGAGERSTPVRVATPSESPGATDSGPRSNAAFDADDGFADVAPWLDDDTPLVRITEPDRGQLETALSIDGPRVVVFETSGTVDLKGRDVTVSTDDCWLAGQTAPSPGVTLVRGRLLVSASDCVVQHLRVRSGDAGRREGFTKESIQVDDAVENVVVDHCTATWGVKTNQSVGDLTDRTTFSNCLIAEGLRDSVHPKGKRSYGTLIGDDADRVAMLGNLWAHNYDWNPRLKEDTDVVLANNVHYHYDGGVSVPASSRLVVQSDAFLRALGARPDIAGTGGVYAADNDCRRPDGNCLDDEVRTIPNRLYWPAEREALPAGEAFERVLDHVGARPADRTHHDERVVEQVREGEGEFVDSQDDVGGYPELPERTRELTVPTRNLRAWLRTQAQEVEPAE